MIKCFRWLKDDMTSENGIKSWKLGKWNKQSGKLKLCENGLHAYTDALDSLNNRFGCKWFITEARGKMLKDKTKVCCSEMRVIKEIPEIVFKRFALFCAKDCLKYYEEKYPKDKRVSDCIKAVEDYLDGKIKINELNAAWSAASAAWSAASAAESAAASAAWSAASAAWSAGSAAWSARSAAASAAESAAASAAESAAASAAWSAWSAASAAESAAEERQRKELMRLIKEYTK